MKPYGTFGVREFTSLIGKPYDLFMGFVVG
jgi:hypothetical protein